MVDNKLIVWSGFFLDYEVVSHGVINTYNKVVDKEIGATVRDHGRIIIFVRDTNAC